MAEDGRRFGDPGTPAFRVSQYPFFLLNRTVSRYNVLIEAGLRTIELDVPTWRVLMILGEQAPRAIGQIAEAAVINLSTMTRIIQRMEAAGLVHSRSSTDDARVTEVSLTALGSEKLEAARAIAAPIYAGLIKGVSARDFDKLTSLLNRLYDNLGAIPRT